MNTRTVLPVALLDVDPTNPRPAPGDVAELVESVRADGILAPLIVRPTPSGRYGVLCGSRRLTAARRIGLAEVPCEIRDALDDATARAVGLAENLHRESLDAISEARAYRRMLDTTAGLTQAALASRLGVSQPRVAQRLKLLELPLHVQDQVAAGEITIDSAYKAAKATRGPLDRPRKRKKRDITAADLAAGRWSGDVLDVLRGINPALPSAVVTAAKAKRQTVEQFITRAVEDRIRELYLGGRP